jgi:aminopeptidase N
VTALTETEARVRAALLDVWSYDVFLDLTAGPAGPARSRTEVRFGCREPGTATFAELTATAVSSVLNGRPVGPAAQGRLGLPELAAENVLVVQAEVAGSALSWFTDAADGAEYLLFMGYPTEAPGVFCCFDQADLTATTTLSLALPGSWDVLTNGPVRERPPAGQAGVWRFGPVRGTRPFDVTIAAGPYVEDWRGEGGSGGAVRMSVRRRRSLAGADGTADLARFAAMARQSLEYYERMLGVPCPWPKYDIGFVPRLDTLALSMPGLMLVNESLLARMTDPDDDKVAMVCAHEVSHLWFGGQVSSRWWDDLWLDEAMATYVSCTAMQDAGLADPWTAFCYREKARAYQADALPGRQPVSSPVATAADAMLRLPALTYSKGTAVIRQLAALIGGDALRAGLADFMRRFGGGTAGLDDLVACWSRSSGRDLGGWAEEWLRSEGASTLRASRVAGPDGTLTSLAVEQDQPRTHRLGIGLYDRSDGGLRRRRVISAEISGARCEVPVPAGEPVPDALVLNDGDLTYAQVAFDPATLDALAEAAMGVGDPLTEAMCWNQTWRMVTAGSLTGADFAGLVIRRLGVSPALPEVGVEVLLERAVTAADLYTAGTERGGSRAAVAAACLHGVSAAGPRQRALAAGFAASAHSDQQLAVARAWLSGGSRPGGLAVDGDLRGRLLQTLAARRLATDDDLDALIAADPVGGEQNRATCRALRPDAAAKAAAWEMALADGPDWRMALASARGIWVPGQEAVLDGYRERYFTEALAALDGREIRVMRYLARALYPATLAEDATLTATAVALEHGALSQPLRLVLEEQEAILRSVLAARSAPRRGWLFLLERRGVGGNVDGIGLEDLQRDDLERALAVAAERPTGCRSSRCARSWRRRGRAGSRSGGRRGRGRPG